MSVDTPLDNTSDFLIKQQLEKWDQELRAALVVLRGARLEQFCQMIHRVSVLCDKTLRDTGPVAKIDLGPIEVRVCGKPNGADTLNCVLEPGHPELDCAFEKPKGWRRG